MESAGSQPKRTGAATAAATGIGAEGSGSGSVEPRSVGGELEPSAEEGQTKVLNEDLMERVILGYRWLREHGFWVPSALVKAGTAPT
jgi:hypothetical protein